MVINNNLFHLIKKIKLNKIKKEYFLTDLINLAVKNNNKVGVVVTKNVLGSMGVNDMNTYIKVKNKYMNRYSLK
jgi:bifunctional N-acetylglucosamine-1-phosphate-uridyltransferase/glucosamine-1-phosphate-acetyltransferase GlmU-like protein